MEGGGAGVLGSTAARRLMALTADTILTPVS